MKARYLILIILAFLMLTSCSFSFSTGNEVQSKKQTIDGVDYLFLNHAEYKNTRAFVVENVRLKNKIYFYGMGKPIDKELKLSDFEKKINSKNFESFHIDSVSFLVSEKKDKIDLIYYINLGNENKSVIFALQKDNETWNLN